MSDQARNAALGGLAGLLFGAWWGLLLIWGGW